MKILVINAGSSSLKYQMIDMDNESVIAKGLVERIGTVDPKSNITHKYNGKKYEAEIDKLGDHNAAMELVLKLLTDKELGVISDLSEIGAVGHRVLHGGEKFTASCLIDDACIAAIEENIPLGPLHNPANLMGIHACQKVLPNVPQVAVFDTAFHQTMPPYAYMYGLPYEYYDKYHIRRYGAHGTSHQFVAKKGAEMVGLDLNNSRIITCHIGNGSSITAIVNGKSIDTSMGLTPLEGLVMGTRCGDVDANAVLYMMKKENLTPDQMYDIVNKKSGFLGVSQKTSDARELDELANNGDRQAKLVLKMLTFQMIKYIGAYTAEMNGVDAIFFTGGIGEHNSRLRRRVCENFTYLGLAFDYEANTAWGVDTVISLPDSKVKVALVTTDEELVIARDTMHLVQSMDE